MTTLDGLSDTAAPFRPAPLRAPDLALLREIVRPRSGWRLGLRQSPPAHELVARLLQHRDRMLRLDQPRVRTSISVFNPGGRRAVSISV